MTLEALYQIILARKQAQPDGSYVAELFRAGEDRIIQKVGEEATEVVIAAKNPDQTRLVSETADLFFHTLVMLAAKGVKLEQVLAELERRKNSSKFQIS